MLLYLYLTGTPLFAFLAWVFSEAFHPGDVVRARVRLPLILTAGMLWPVLLVGVAQIQVMRMRAKLVDPEATPA
ncbi:hypothetical protein [Mycolicibacterium rhodesiae]|uniref:hypothetical protein n=1 Tax=Mycolicibacterium rhodesiae TaxID=36814 RepID=UPI0010568EDB|nr:hypothetical protein [Mycolicibacterium rhodesiae]MCV7347722.1 hypothetical protein [Mycolicibacterium rhodesiae]